jgi:plasmid stabilization system protein ParE
MRTVTLSLQAKLDIEEIRIFWRRTSAIQRSRTAAELRKIIQNIGANPYIGSGQSELTRIYGEEVRSRLCGNYRIFYFVSRPIPEIFAILHTSRDLRETLANRAQ